MSEEAVAALEATGDYRVLRRLRIENFIADSPQSGDRRVGLIFDCETTGLDPQRDQIIEIGMLRFVYNPASSQIYSIDGSLSSMLIGFPPTGTRS